MPISFETNPLNLYDAILRTAAYEDVFDYALTAGEIHRLLSGICTGPEIVENALHDHSVMSFSEGYYTLPGREALVTIRRRRNQAAERLWLEAVRYGKIIANLPFVRMLAVTGSLAMNNVGAGADIDYLVVTAAGRLWTCRALVLAVARLAALRRVRLCPNYLITERALSFPDRSLYTAHELVQMIPLFGMDIYNQIRNLNLWTERFLPNAEGVPPSRGVVSTKHAPGRVQSALEAGLLLPPGSWLERWEMDRKIQQLSHEQDENPEANFSMDVCKGHIHRHGLQTELSFRQRLKAMALELGYE